jgi:GT2 family glycosyltransferase
MHRIAVIIPVHNRKTKTLECLRNLSQLTTENRFLLLSIVIDDGSTDGTADAIAKDHSDVIVLKGDGNLWWAGGVNFGFRYALENDFDFVYTVNDDVKVEPATLLELYQTLAVCRSPTVCGSVFLNDGRVVSAGYRKRRLLSDLRPFLRGTKYSDITGWNVVDADSLSTSSALIPVNVIRTMGCFDSNRFPHNYSDLDYFDRLKSNGCRLLVNLESRVYTKGSDSNFHSLLLSLGCWKILLTFFNVKYGNNIKTLFRRATVRRNPILGCLLFFSTLLVHGAWFLSRVFLGRTGFAKLLALTGKGDVGS